MQSNSRSLLSIVCRGRVRCVCVAYYVRVFRRAEASRDLVSGTILASRPHLRVLDRKIATPPNAPPANLRSRSPAYMCPPPRVTCVASARADIATGTQLTRVHVLTRAHTRAGTVSRIAFTTAEPNVLITCGCGAQPREAKIHSGFHSSFGCMSSLSLPSAAECHRDEVYCQLLQAVEADGP